MKSYSGIPYTTGKQAADDVKTQLVGFIKIPKWLLGLCLITVFYILFVCFSMYKIGDSTTQLYEYPYTVSRKAQEMKTALYGIRISLPSLLATPDITAAQLMTSFENRGLCRTSRWKRSRSSSGGMRKNWLI